MISGRYKSAITTYTRSLIPEKKVTLLHNVLGKHSLYAYSWSTINNCPFIAVLSSVVAFIALDGSIPCSYCTLVVVLLFCCLANNVAIHDSIQSSRVTFLSVIVD